jgi:hypothetical protein
MHRKKMRVKKKQVIGPSHKSEIDKPWEFVFGDDLGYIDEDFI